MSRLWIYMCLWSYKNTKKYLLAKLIFYLGFVFLITFTKVAQTYRDDDETRQSMIILITFETNLKMYARSYKIFIVNMYIFGETLTLIIIFERHNSKWIIIKLHTVIAHWNLSKQNIGEQCFIETRNCVPSVRKI